MALSPSVTPRLDRSALTRMADAGAKAVSLSLDGPDPSVHDAFRGVAGVYAATIPAARQVRELGMRLQVNTTVTSSTLPTLPGVLEQVLDLDAFLWSVFFLVGTGRGAELAPVSPEETEDVLHWLVDVSRYLPVKTTEAPHYRRVVLQRRAAQGADPVRAFGLGPTYRRLRGALDELVAVRQPPTRTPRPPLDVNAGRGFVFVDHLGVVYPSGFLPLRAGSVRDASLVEIYRTSPVLRTLRRPDGFGGRCGRCEFRTVCGGSRSRAQATSGDHLAEDPSCLHVPGTQAADRGT